MAIKIHYGPNGSYKSAGAIWDDMVPAMREGRTIVTNVRGMSEERCRKVLGKLPETFKMIHVDMDSADGLERCRTWFRWVPKGAMVVFDETQLIFLKSWREKYLERFNHPGGPDAASAADVPSSFLDAFTRHRHWNWDIILTTPNIKMIRSDIRETSEAAYRHSNFALLGPIAKRLLGDYKETFHDAQLNAAPPKAITKLRRINKTVFKLYDSTATGKTQDTRAGTSIFASMPLMVGTAVIVACVGLVWSRGGVSLLSSSKPAQPAALPLATGPVVPDSRAAQHSAVPVRAGVDRPAGAAGLIRDLFTTYVVHLEGYYQLGDVVSFDLGFYRDGDTRPQFTISTQALRFAGLSYNLRDRCLLSIEDTAAQFAALATCAPVPVDDEQTTAL